MEHAEVPVKSAVSKEGSDRSRQIDLDHPEPSWLVISTTVSQSREAPFEEVEPPSGDFLVDRERWDHRQQVVFLGAHQQPGQPTSIAELRGVVAVLAELDADRQ